MSSTSATDRAHAAVWSAPGTLDMTDLEVPDAPPGGLLLEVIANGICGTDLHLLNSTPARPTVPGHEIVGRICEFGVDAPRVDAGGAPLSHGDRVALFPWVPCRRCWQCERFGPAAAVCSEAFVYGIPPEFTGVAAAGQGPAGASALTGGFGSHLAVREGTYLWRVPDQTPTARASLLDPLAVAVRAVAMARTPVGTWDEVLRADAIALVQGAGPVGLLVTAVLRAHGIGKVIVTGSRPARLAAARRMGAETVVDVRSTTIEERHTAVMAATSGRGCDLVIDCTNDPAALVEGIRSVRRMGTVIEVGNMVNTGTEVLLDPASDICLKNIRLLGMSVNPPQSYAEAMALLSRADIAWDSLITAQMPLSDPKAALRKLAEPDSIKVVLVSSDGTSS
ncbi:MAG: hypothetical protein CVT64_09560 [Actinobacteria bacterium HGW-Actinobacteria-4]|nr:MAG: hypothetical protein CVT64_09560 [Actinobacteria bacterium HGW-Actinobacteria-4]